MAALITWTGHNFADDAVLTVTSGVVDSNFPLANLKLRGLASECRSIPQGPFVPLEITIDNLDMPYERWDQGFAPDPNGQVQAIAVQSDGKIIIGGSFTQVGGVFRNRIARLNPDGSLDSGFNPNANGTVLAIAIHTDGKIYIAGDCTTVGGITRNRIARLNANGTVDTSFNPGTGLNNQVNALAVNTDGSVIVGGTFTTANGTTRNRIAKFSTTGKLETFNPNSNSTVNAIAVQPDGKIIIGGSFTQVGGVFRNRIARLLASGGVDSVFNPNANGEVRSLALRDDGWIYIGGTFTAVDGYSRERLARISEFGDVDVTFSPSANLQVDAITILATGGVVIGGAFSHINSSPRQRVARLEDDGTLDPNFTGPPSTSSGYALAPTQGGVYFGCLNSQQGHMFHLRTQAPNEVRLVALLGLSFVQDHTGDVVVEQRPSLSAAWTELARQSLLSFRHGLAALPTHMGILLPSGIPASSQWRITITSSDVAPIGIGRLWIGEALVLPDGIDAGWQMGFRDSGSLDATDGQQWVQSPGVITRVLTIPLEGARDTEIHWGFAEGSEIVTNAMSLNALQLEAGVTGEVIAVARTLTTLWTSRAMVYGHIDSPWAIGHTAGPFWGGSLTVVEER